MFILAFHDFCGICYLCGISNYKILKNFYQTFSKPLFSLWLFALWCGFSFQAFPQCDVTTPSFIVDLSGNPDSIWIETNTTRLDSCCYQQDADPCIMFIVTLPPNVGGLYFSVENPQPSISASQFHINCDTVAYSVQDTVCVAGYTPPYVITYCKPGNDKPDYIIAGIGEGEISPPIVVSDACTDTIYGTGFKEATITWTSYPYNPTYQGFLSDTIGQDTVVVTPTGIYPDSLQYIICGELAGLNCSSGSTVKCDTTTVYFVTNFSVAIAPQNPSICFGGGPVTLTANASGGALPYSYLWNTGDTTQSIDVFPGNAGLYWVEVKDTLECAGVSDSVTVTEYTSSIDAYAGPDLPGCAGSPSVTLNGTIQAASGGIWSGGTGTFTPDDTTLNAVYTPDSAEIAAGMAVLVLTSTGNGSCPADSDSLTIFISPNPVVNSGVDQSVCANEVSALLSGTITGGSSSGQWTSAGSGSFSPNDSALNASYNFSVADISAGTVTLFLASTNNGPCAPALDSLQLTIMPAITVNAGNDQVVCINNSTTSLSGSVAGATTTGVWSGTGSGVFSPNDSDLTANYIPSPGDTSAGSVIIILSSTNNGGCTAVTDSFTLVFAPDITWANAGNDIFECSNTSGILLSGQVSGATGGTWSTAGNGSFSPSPDSLNTQYIPDGNDTLAGFVSLILSTTGTLGCLEKNDTLLVSFLASVLIDAGNDTAICFSDTSIAVSGSVSQAPGGFWSSSGNGTFSPGDSILNATYFPGTDDYLVGNATLTLSSYGGCANVSDTMLLTILPFANAGNDLNACATDPAVSLSGQSSAGASVQWTSTGTGSFSPSDTILNPDYYFSSSDTSSGSVFLVLSVSGITYGCPNASDTLELIISPPPFVFAGNDTSICSTDSSLALSGIIQNAGTNQWTSSGNGTFSPGDSSLNTTYFFGSSDYQTGIIVLSLTGYGGCVVNSDSLLLNIVPFADAGADQYLCSSDTQATLTGAATAGAPVLWTTSGTGSFSPDDTTLNAIYLISSADSTAGFINISLSVSGSGFGCSNTSDTITVYILPPPVANAGPDLSVCENNIDVQLGGTIYGALGGVWSSGGDGTFSPDSTFLSATYSPGTNDIANGFFNLTLTTTGSCVSISDIMTGNITPAPTANAGPNVSVCSTIPVVGLNGAVTVATGGTWSSSGTGIFSPDSVSLSATYLPSDADTTAGNITIYLTTTGNGNCLPVTDSLYVTIYSDLISAFAGNDTSVCSSGIQLSGIVLNATGGNWSTAGDGFFSPSPSVLSPVYNFAGNDTAGGTVALVLTTTGNGSCLPKTDTILVGIIGEVAVNVSAVDTFCANGGAIPVNGNASTGSGTWISLGDGSFFPDSNSLNPDYLPGTGDTSSGSVTLIFTSTNNGPCSAASDTLNIELIPGPMADFSASGVCHLEQVIFSDSTYPSADVVSWLWDFGDGNTDNAQNTSHTYATDSSYSVSLTVVSTNGCVDSVSKQVIIHPLPAADFSETSQCFVDSVYFSDLSLISSDSIVSWYWEMGDGNSSAQQNPGHFYINSGSYVVSLTVTSDFGCTDSISKSIVVQPSPIAGFSGTLSCLSQSTVFSDSSTIFSGNIVSWNWDFGDGSFSSQANPSHAFSSEGTFNVQLVVASDSGCTDTLVKQVTVYPSPEADFVNNSECTVDSVFLSDISVISSGTIVQWFWDFGDGNSSSVQNPAHVYASLGNYSVTLVVVSDAGCTDTVLQGISVAPAPVAGFLMSNNTVCLNQPILFADVSTIQSGSIILWNWDFGDGTTASTSSVFHSFSTSDTFTVTLSVTSDLGCTDSASLDVFAFPSPLSDFYFNGTCINEGTLFFDSSFANPDTMVSWQWYFGDGGVSYSENPTHFYPAPGDYQVSLISATNNGCKDTTSQVISINPAPVAGFDIDKHVGINEDVFNFSNFSTGSIAWTWDFGDSTGTSTGQNPSYSYSTGGIFYIMLIAENEFDCKDTAMDSVIVNIPPKVPNGFSPNGDGKNDLLLPMGGPFKKVEFKIFNSWGEMIFLSENSEEGWDGKKNGIDQPMGVYVFLLYAITEDGEEFNLHGDVTLLR